MESSTLARLLEPEVYARLADIEYRPADELALASRLRKSGLDPDTAAALVSQAALRLAAAEKFGPFAAGMLFTRDGLAQATRLPVAAHHAQRMLASDPQVIADLGCGLGADTMAFAGLGGTVEAVEADEVTAAIATFNLRSLDTVTVTHGRAEDYDLTRASALWLDPARRTSRADARGNATRISDPEAFSPSLSWAFTAAEQVPATGIKLGPALDHELVPPGWEAQWVSHDGDVVEVALYHGEARQEAGRNALVLGADRAVRVHESEVPAEDEDRIGELGDFLFEPDGALVRAGLVTALCAPLGARRISKPIAYLTGDRLPGGAGRALVRSFRIRDVLPAGLKPLRRALVERGVGKVVIKKRGADIVPDTVRRRLKLPPGEQATLVFTRLGEDHVVLLVDEVTDAA
ncbi:50S ribosomal protein L11 methyltransferase [Brevibacterium daeguense]|uniref:50S ribosomal protein L11 methyltransferase n=1 Tax=Brevibacterium daeguense TaxID=909936 RepID=A0ABP8EFV7_9MICO|nr:class I SAM-dependent methyltransferase [Brevibacterium daeguense]